ncbi:MAG: Dam family site-specific DNA-(adenine-N6)-methyltransferase [Dehalococcoidales bacterium]|nr:Dam family site-specific DNA-(adenine-N6)-methyltransferase [Dehalococcoidales bacterium]
MKIFIPPIKCQGIKSKMVPWIIENVNFSQKGRWIEPFMGSGVVGFNARPVKAKFSDLNPYIIDFYEAVKHSRITPASVRIFLEHEGEFLRRIGEEYYYTVRKRFNKERNPQDFLFLSRACFNGIIRFNSKGEFNVPFCKKPDRFAKAYITKIVNQVQNVYELLCVREWDFSHKDFRLAISGATEDDFIYCDPPYFGRHTDYFNTWNESDENDLYRCLLDTKANFILSTWHGNEYRQNPIIDKYWREFYILKQDHFYHVGAKESNRKPMVEAIVMNYQPRGQAMSKPLVKQLILMEEKVKYITDSGKP